ncbi:MAG: CPBP family intramembrane metalloprotease [Coriobacteriia bacterium]|nr:CPBP family intramembrane metalloprotease [Coriobacteriia bacterium]
MASFNDISNDLLPQPEMIAQAKVQSKSRKLIAEIGIFFLIFIIYVIIQGIAAGFLFALLQTGFIKREAFETVFDIFILFITIIIIILVLIYCRFIEKRKLQTMGFERTGMFSEYLIGLAIGFLMFAASVLICVVTGTLVFQGVASTISWSLLLLFFFGYVIQGMSEEVLCRSYLMVSIARRQTIPLAILVSSATFSALHFANPNTSALAFVNLFLFGVFAAVYFVKRGDIWAIAAIHSSWNFVQGNVFGIAVSGKASEVTIFRFVSMSQHAFINGGDFGLEGGIAVTIVLVVSILLVLMTKSRKTHINHLDNFSPPAFESQVLPPF